LSNLDWIDYLVQFGYPGVFLLSFIGAITVIFPIPYTLTYYVLGATLDPLFIAIAGGLGSALGEFSGYVLGYFGRAIVSEDHQRRMLYLLKIFDRYGALLVFLFALTPLPDDLLFIPLGIMRYNFFKAFIPSLCGKMLMAYILAYSGKISFQLIQTIFGEAGLVGTLLMVMLLAVIIVIMLRIDWEQIFKKYVERE
jgi:membrane protein YqaA with SNARE-associated domain